MRAYERRARRFLISIRRFARSATVRPLLSTVLMRTTLAVGLLIASTTLACDELFESPYVVSPRPAFAPEYDDVPPGYGVWSDDALYGVVWTPNDPAYVPYATLRRGTWLYVEDRWRWAPPRW